MKLKKLLSLALALVLIFSLCVLFATAEEEEPSAYIWLKADASFQPSLIFKVDGSLFTNKSYNIIANVYFGDDCQGSGVAFVNYYSYDDPSKYGDYSHLIQFKDFAAHNGEGVELGKWASYTFAFNPFEALYSGGTNVEKEGNFAKNVGLLSVGIGFYEATGTIKVASILINEVGTGTAVWTRSFSEGLDPEDDTLVQYANLPEDKKGTNWDVVIPTTDTQGNLALDAEISHNAGFGDYNVSLNDGVAAQDKTYANWFGFYWNGDTNPSNNTTIENIEGKDYRVGTVDFDFGEAKTWNKVRANIWDAAGYSGIGSHELILVYYSDDGENWEEAGDLLLTDQELEQPGLIYWAEKEFAQDITSQYVRLKFCWSQLGVFVFLNEIEIIEANTLEIPDVSEETSEADQTSEAGGETTEDPDESSEETSGTTPTGDSGIVALAIVSVIVLAGAVVFKKR